MQLIPAFPQQDAANDVVNEQLQTPLEAGVHVQGAGGGVEGDIVAPVEAMEVEGEGGRGLDGQDGCFGEIEGAGERCECGCGVA